MRVAGRIMKTYKKLGLRMIRGGTEKTWTVRGDGIEFSAPGNKGTVMSAFLEADDRFILKTTGWEYVENK